jgi:hypothetical protein
VPSLQVSSLEQLPACSAMFFWSHAFLCSLLSYRNEKNHSYHRTRVPQDTPRVQKNGRMTDPGCIGNQRTIPGPRAHHGVH